MKLCLGTWTHSAHRRGLYLQQPGKTWRRNLWENKAKLTEEQTMGTKDSPLTVIHPPSQESNEKVKECCVNEVVSDILQHLRQSSQMVQQNDTGRQPESNGRNYTCFKKEICPEEEDYKGKWQDIYHNAFLCPAVSNNQESFSVANTAQKNQVAAQLTMNFPLQSCIRGAEKHHVGWGLAESLHHWMCAWRGLWDPSPVLLPFCFPTMRWACSSTTLPPGCAASPQDQNQQGRLIMVRNP